MLLLIKRAPALAAQHRRRSSPEVNEPGWFLTTADVLHLTATTTSAGSQPEHSTGPGGTRSFRDEACLGELETYRSLISEG
jgi:hypothetical protein